jgi:hypothetical protein
MMPNVEILPPMGCMVPPSVYFPLNRRFSEYYLMHPQLTLRKYNNSKGPPGDPDRDFKFL